MPVKRSTGSLIAVSLVSFAAGMIVSRRKCRGCSTDSNVRKWGRLYLDVKDKLDAAIDDEAKFIIKQLLEKYVDRRKYGSNDYYTFAYNFQRINVEGKKLVEIQFYTVRITGPRGDNAGLNEGAKAFSREGDAPAPLAMMSTLDIHDQTPPSCPRPRPRFETMSKDEGFICDSQG